MQKVEEITSMFPQINHHTDSSIHHESTHESNKTITNFQEELQMPFSSENSSDSQKYKPEEPDCKSQAPNEALEEEADHEELDTCNTEVATTVPTKSEGTASEDSSSSGRERLKRHRVEVAGRVWIPDMWGQEDFLKDWIDCAAFDASLVNSSIMSARASLVEEGTRANSTRLRVENSF